MTGVTELLAAAGPSAPVQRVRNYHLTDREASPRPRDFLTAMKRTDGDVCVRWAGPPGVSGSGAAGVLENRRFSGCGESAIRNSSSDSSDGDCVVRYADPGWECAKHNRFRGRSNVETLDAERVRAWLRRSNPELVAHEAVSDAFDEGRSGSPPSRARTGTALADGGEDRDARRRDRDARRRDPDARGRASDETRCTSDGSNRVRIERSADLLGETELDRFEAQALAAALPAGAGEVVFRLPLVLAEESVLESVAGSDCVFVAEVVPERETECAYYVRQDHRGCWVPKGEATFYELADGVTLDVEPPESPESA